MDNTQSRAKQVRLLIFIVLIVSAALIIFEIIRDQKFHVVSTNPSVNSVSSVAPFFKINFNKTLVSSSIKLTATPSIIASYSVSGKTIDITLLSLNLAKAYKIVLNSATDTNNQTLSNQTFSFVTKDISAANLPKDEQQAIQKNQEVYPAVTKDPIIQYLPHQTLNYSLSAHIIQETNGQSELVLQADIQLNQADMSNQDAAVASYKQQIMGYIQSLGLNPNNYTIDYTVSSL